MNAKEIVEKYSKTIFDFFGQVGILEEITEESDDNDKMYDADIRYRVLFAIQSAITEALSQSDVHKEIEEMLSHCRKAREQGKTFIQFANKEQTVLLVDTMENVCQHLKSFPVQRGDFTKTDVLEMLRKAQSEFPMSDDELKDIVSNYRKQNGVE